MKLVTPSALCERLKINVSLARAACRYLAKVRYYCFILLFSVSYIECLFNGLGGQDSERRHALKADDFQQERLNELYFTYLVLL